MSFQESIAKLWGMFLEFAPKLLAAVVILLVGWWLSKKVAKVIGRALERAGMDLAMQKFIVKTVKIACLIVITIIAAATVGIPTSSLITVLASACVAVGVALKDNISNIASGIILVFTQPFDLGDYVEIGGQGGTAIEIKSMFTVLRTPDNKRITIPNATVVKSPIINYSVEETRRMDVVFLIDKKQDFEQAKQAALQIATQNPLVFAEPQPFAAINNNTANGTELVLRIWCKNADYWTVYYQLREGIKTEFDKRGIEIPAAQTKIYMAG